MKNQRFVCSRMLALILPVTLGLACGLKRDWNYCTSNDPCKPGYICTAEWTCVLPGDGGSDGLVAVDGRGATDAVGGGLDWMVSVGGDAPGGTGQDAGEADHAPASPLTDAAAGIVPALDGRADQVQLDAPLDVPVATAPDAPAVVGTPDAPPAAAPPDAPPADKVPDSPAASSPPDAPSLEAPTSGPTLDAAGTCSTDKDCAGGPAGFCDTSTKRCVACLKRTDCAGGCQTCSSGVCTAVKNQDDPTACAGTCDSSGACKSKQGQTCQATPGGCLAGTTCAPDGYCCDQACTSPCLACDIAGFLGTCTPVASGNPHGNRTSCGSDATCGGTCAGKADGTCSYPTKPCGPAASCSGADKVLAQSSCANGTCPAQTATTCTGGLACAAGACNTTCTTSADCQADYFCRGGTCHSDVVSVATGQYHTCAALKDGRVVCWGSGPLGDNISHGTAVLSPVQVLGLTDAKQVRAAQKATCALRTSGAVSCWGTGDTGQLGTGTNTPASGQSSYFSNVPVSVVKSGGGQLTGATMLSAGQGAFCATSSTSTYCWGENWDGALGFDAGSYGTAVLSATPLSGCGPFKSMAMGSLFQAGWISGGAVSLWGFDMGGIVTSATALATFPDCTAHSAFISPNVSEIAAGGSHVCVLLVTGAVQCWGQNGSGQLGNGTVSAVPDVVPGHVIPSFTATHLGAGGTFSCAVTTDQRNVTCWGSNLFLVVSSDNSINNQPTPMTVPLNLAQGLTVSEVVSAPISAHVCAIISDGSLMCWGYNYGLQTGTGSTDNAITPAFVQANW
jgi:alpha-tubulin suppressor-like RCC1 family protein